MAQSSQKKTSQKKAAAPKSAQQQARARTQRKSAGASSASRRETLRQQQAAHARAQRNRRVLMIVAGIVALAIIAVVGTVIWKDQANKRSQKTTEASAQLVPPHAVGTDAIDAFPGKGANAKYTLDIFVDYQCPICHRTEDTYSKVWDELGNEGFMKVHIRTMTFLDNNLRNDDSTMVAIGAACADLRGKYLQFHEAAFNNQPEHEVDGYSDEAVKTTIAQQAGITGADYTAWRQCLDNKSTAKFVRQVDESASRAGVTGTPTLMVNGKNPVSRVEGGENVYWWQELPADADAWKAAIEKAAAS